MTEREILAQRDRELEAINRAGARASRRITFAYRRLFPLSMLTLLFVGYSEYERRTYRYAAFTRKVLRAQTAETARTVK